MPRTMKEIQDDQWWNRLQGAIIGLHFLAFGAFFFYIVGAFLDGVVQLWFFGSTPRDRVISVMVKDGVEVTYPIFRMLIPFVVILALIFQKPKK